MKKILILILILAFGITGCEKSDESSGDKNENNVTSAIDSEYIHLTMLNPKTINPVLNKDESVGYITSLIYDGLFTIDENYNVKPQLVEEHGIDTSGKSIYIKLKDAKWHNGDPLTSNDVKFTVDFIKRNSESPYYPFVENISSVSIINDREMNINFKEVYPFSINTLVFPILHKNSLSSLSTANAMEHENNLVGSGPYKIEMYKERKGMELSLYEDYHSEVETNSKGIQVGIVPDMDAQVAMVIALESDMSKIDIDDLSRLYEEEFNITNYQGRDYEQIIFNYDNEFLRDTNFRKAIAYSIDREKVLEEAYMEDATLVNFPINTKSVYYDEGLEYYEYNIEKAKAYLEKSKPIPVEENKETEENQDSQEANNTEESNNETEQVEESLENEDSSNEANTTSDEQADSENNSDSESDVNIKNKEYTQEEIDNMIKALDLKIVVNADNLDRVKTAHLVKSGLKEIGVNSTVLELKGEELDKALTEKDYDIALVGWELSNIPDVTSIISNSGYMDEKLNQYMSSLMTSTSETQTLDIYKSMQKHITEQVSFISLVIKDDYMVTNKRIKGDLNPNEFDVYNGVYNLNINK